jgi:broad-specificity NMP kinase
MVKQHFYSSIIEVESLIVELDKMDLSDQERKHLASLIDSNLHHTIVDVILSELSEEDKKIFLDYLQNDDHEKIWDHLKDKIENIEDKIKTAADQLKEELHMDIKKSQRLK